jgi:hypothetical protein
LISDEYIYLRKTTENRADHTFIHNPAGQTLFCRSFNDQSMAFFSLGGSTASTIVKKANLLLVLETETILNYKMQNGIIEYTEGILK